jgi:hypothetical protein
MPEHPDESKQKLEPGLFLLAFVLYLQIFYPHVEMPQHPEQKNFPSAA